MRLSTLLSRSSLEQSTDQLTQSSDQSLEREFHSFSPGYFPDQTGNYAEHRGATAGIPATLWFHNPSQVHTSSPSCLSFASCLLPPCWAGKEYWTDFEDSQPLQGRVTAARPRLRHLHDNRVEM